MTVADLPREDIVEMTVIQIEGEIENLLMKVGDDVNLLTAYDYLMKFRNEIIRKNNERINEY